MEKLMIFSLIVTVILMICFFGLYCMYVKLKIQYTKIRESYDQLTQLNGELRRQRHDYLNHCQVVYGMVELEEYEELKNYVEPVYKDLMKTGKALRTSNPAVNALLRAKMAEAEEKGIDFYVEVKSSLLGLKIEPWELCKVLSNLIDNAFTALEDKENDKKIRLDITETKDSFDFLVINNGPMIPKEMQQEIFKDGVTTKKEKNGHGLGLAIVAKTLSENNGKIELSSLPEETCFTVRLLK